MDYIVLLYNIYKFHAVSEIIRLSSLQTEKKVYDKQRKSIRFLITEGCCHVFQDEKRENRGAIRQLL